jgi:glycosyltransferase involved in cell wall biosynthesis
VILYNGAALFVFPSLYEGFGLPALEAMACGTPVVASNISSIPEVLGEAALYVDPYNIGELVSNIHHLLISSQLRQKMISRGLERAKLFSWEKTAKDTLTLYHDVHNGNVSAEH